MPRRRKTREERAFIQNCEQRFRFVCPQQWTELEATDDPRVRHCNVCEKRVYYCEAVEEADRLAAEGKCVAWRFDEIPVVGGMETDYRR